jgi:hypothetical protein
MGVLMFTKILVAATLTLVAFTLLLSACSKPAFYRKSPFALSRC